MVAGTGPLCVGAPDGSGEGELLARLREGAGGALDGLMARYASRVYRLARGIARNDADAEEVVQDVFVTLLRKHESFEGRSALGWERAACTAFSARSVLILAGAGGGT